MKIYAKLAVGMVAFGFLLSVLGAIAIRTQAQHTQASGASAVAAVDTTMTQAAADATSTTASKRTESEPKKEAAAVQKK